MGDLGGSKIGSLGFLVTLGSGTSSKVIRRGVTWTESGTGGSGWRKEAGCGGGIQAGTVVAATIGERGVATLGSLLATLGSSGARTWPGDVGGGLSLHHDSNRSHWLAIASTWEMLVGGGASLRAHDMTWRPWILLSSGEGKGMVQ
jgi:hypothetical protein